MAARPAKLKGQLSEKAAVEKPKHFSVEGTGKLERKVQKQQDEFELAGVSFFSADTLARMGNRVLKFFIVGLVWEFQENQSKNKAKKDAPERKRKEDDKPKDYKSSLYMVAFAVLVFLMRYGEESFDAQYALRDDEGVNHYEVLSVPTTVEDTELRQAYKKLALKWHPDKNKNCTQCVEKFNQIATSYELLHDKEKRTAYDEGRSETVAHVARASTTITKANFQHVVGASNDLWVIQLYDSGSASGSFHPIWEDLSAKNQRIIKFGRIDVDKDKDALGHLQLKVGYPPTVFLHAPKIGHTVVVPRYSTSRASVEIPRFIFDSVPRYVQVLQDKKSVRQFFSDTSKQVRVLLVGNLLKKQGFGLEARTAAYRWSEFASFAFVSAKIFKELVHPDTLAKWADADLALPAEDETDGLVVATRGGVATLKTEAVVRKIASLSTGIQSDLEEVIGDFVDQIMPTVTQQSLDLLCRSRFQRRFCLVLTDGARAAQAQVVSDLAASRAQYLQDLSELRANDVEDVEEEFWIQPVYAATLPGSLKPIDLQAFPALGAAHGLVIDIETMRYAELRAPSVKELYTQIAYEDLPLEAVPEDWSLEAALCNPMETVGTQVRWTFVSPLRIFGCVLILGLAVGALPEFKWDLYRLAGLVALVAAVFLGAIPAARRDGLRWILAVVKVSAV